MADGTVNMQHKFYRTFSGTDTLAFLIMPGCVPIVLGSLTTISYSIFRNKKPVINIGRTNINGVTRGSRIYAGTMIFTLINQHWLRELQEQCSWMGNLEDLKTDELPLFDIMVVSANEYGSAVEMYIFGIDFTDEAQTISVEDLFTENTFSFIARELSTFKKFNVQTGVHKHSAGVRDAYEGLSQRFHVLDSSVTSIEDLAALERAYVLNQISYEKNLSKKLALPFNGDLYRSNSDMRISNETANLQELLNNIDSKYYHDVNGIFDEWMEGIVRLYQSDHGLDVTGIVDIRTYNSIVNDLPETKEKTAIVVNRYGTPVYEKPSVNSNIVDTKTYKETVRIFTIVTNEDDGEFKRYYQTDNGYIPEENLYSSLYTGNVIEFPTIEYGDSSSYVVMAKAALSTLYPHYVDNSPVYDEQLRQMVKMFQRDNNLEETGIIDMNTWRVLQGLTSVGEVASKDKFSMKYSQPPGEYKLDKKELSKEVPNFYVDISCENSTNVKVTTISKYNDKQVVDSKGIVVQKNGKISLEQFKNAFMYNPECGKTPDSVDFIVYPYNKGPYKWTFTT